MLKTFIAVVAGLFAGVAVVMGGDYLGSLFFKMPDGIDMSDSRAVEELMKTVPVATKLVMLGGWLLSALVGGFVAGKIDSANWKRTALITGSIQLIGAVVNMVMIPHPVWMMIIALLGYIPLALAGGKLASGTVNTGTDA